MAPTGSTSRRASSRPASRRPCAPAARFILRRVPTHVRTVCLEFFGLAREAVPAIVEIKNHVEKAKGVLLAGLEHLDERYVKAVGYATKSRRNQRPRMVLIGDLGGDDGEPVASGAPSGARAAARRPGGRRRGRGGFGCLLGGAHRQRARRGRVRRLLAGSPQALLA